MSVVTLENWRPGTHVVVVADHDRCDGYTEYYLQDEGGGVLGLLQVPHDSNIFLSKGKFEVTVRYLGRIP